MNKTKSLIVLLFSSISFISFAKGTVDIKILNYSEKIEPSFNFMALTEESQFKKTEKIVKFLLSNSGGGTIVINKLYVEIISYDSYVEYTFPRGPLLPISKFSYSVDIDDSAEEFLITEQKFKYSKGEVDEFEVRVQAKKEGIYLFKIVAEGEDIEKNEKYVNETKAYKIVFPQIARFQQVIKLAKKSIKVYLNGHQFTELVLGQETLFFLHNKIRRGELEFQALVDVDYYYHRYTGMSRYSAALFAENNYILPYSAILLVDYDNVRPYFPGPEAKYKPFILIDDVNVLTKSDDYFHGKIEYIVGDGSSKFKRYFESLWIKEPYLTEDEYVENITNTIGTNLILSTKEFLDTSNDYNSFNTKSINGRTLEYIHLLRYASEPNKIKELFSYYSEGSKFFDAIKESVDYLFCDLDLRKDLNKTQASALKKTIKSESNLIKMEVNTTCNNY
jgi:hypothetical protein